jgi:uncharacterized phage-associated protein
MKYDIEKVANAIKFFKEKKVKNLGKTKLMKLLFFADKEHLSRYGIPIFYDKYFKLPHGPVPSLTLNIIDSLNEGENFDLMEYTEVLKEHISIKEVNKNGYIFNDFEIKKPFNDEVFSKSELEVLELIANKYKDITASKISELSHLLPEYKNTPLSEIIDYSKMATSQAEYIEFVERETKELESILY